MWRLLAKIQDTLGLGGIKDVDSPKRLWPLILAVGAIIGAVIALTTPWKAASLVVLAAVGTLAFFRPQAVVLFLAAFVPFEPFLLKFVGDDVYVFARYFSEGLIYLILLVAVWRRVSSGKRLFGTALGLPFVGFLIVALASWTLNTVPLTFGALGLRQIIRFILLFFAIVWLNPEQRHIRRVTIVMFGIALFQGLLGLVQSIVGAPLDEFLIPGERRFFESIQLTSGTQQFWSPGTRVFATLGRYDQLGTFLSFFFMLAIGLAYQTVHRVERRILLGFVALCLPAFVMTLSRASWFGAVLGLIVIGLWLMRDRRIRYGLVAVIIAGATYLAYTGVIVKYLTDYPGQTPIERVFEAFSYERWRGEYYGLGRVYWVVQTVMTVVPSSPLFGVGPGQYGGGAVAALGNTRAYDKLNLPFGVYGTDGYIDNNWFAIWGETGTLGLLFYAMMVFLLARTAFRLWRRSSDRFVRGLALGYLGAVIAVSFQALLATYLETRTLGLYLWLYGAFIYVMARREKITE